MTEIYRTIIPDLVGPVKAFYPTTDEVVGLLKDRLPSEEKRDISGISGLLTRPDIISLVDSLPDCPDVSNGQRSIMFYPTNKTNQNTCQGACDNCYLRNGLPSYEVPMQEAVQIIEDLRGRGYTDIGLTPPDSFSQNFLGYGAEASGSGYRFDKLQSISWSSGRPIATVDDWEKLLGYAYEKAGFRNVFINAQKVAGTPVPFRGVTEPDVIREAISRILKWNERYPDKKIGTGLTFTITTENNSLDYMRTMLKFCLDNGINLFRFNRFNIFGMKKPDLMPYVPSPEDINGFFGNFAKLMSEIPSEAQIDLSFSQDFGDSGIKQVREFLPQEYADFSDIGRCRAGRYFLTIVQDKKITDPNKQLIVAACTDGFRPVVGFVKKQTDGKWGIEWDQKALNRIYYLRELINEETGQPMLYGCFGGNIGDQRFNDPRVEKILYAPT